MKHITNGVLGIFLALNTGYVYAGSYKGSGVTIGSGVVIGSGVRIGGKVVTGNTNNEQKKEDISKKPTELNADKQTKTQSLEEENEKGKISFNSPTQSTISPKETYISARVAYQSSKNKATAVNYLDVFGGLTKNGQKQFKSEYFDLAKNIVKAYPKDQEVWTNYCWSALLVNHTVADTACMKAYKLDVYERNANINLAHLYHKKSNTNKAKLYFKQASYVAPLNSLEAVVIKDFQRLSYLYSSAEQKRYLTFFKSIQNTLVNPYKKSIVEPYSKMEDANNGLTEQQETKMLLKDIQFVTQHLGADSVMNALSYQRLANINTNTNDSKKYSEKALTIFNTHGLNEQNSNNVTLNIEF